MTTKEKILKSALRLFATQGIDKTSTAQITRDVGISSGALFVHFKTKKELIYVLYMNIKEEAMHGIEDICDSGKPVEDNIKSIAKILIEHYIAHYHEFIFMELVENDPAFSQAAFKETQELYSGFLNFVSQWIKEGKLKNLEVEFILRVMWNILVVVIHHSKKKRLNKAKDEYLDIVWEAVRG